MRTLLLMALALAACTRPSSVPPAGAQEVRVVGVPAAVGSAPMNVRVFLRPASGEGVYVTGPLAGEIRSLSGAQVEVRGRRGPDRTLEAVDYDVLTVNGRPVVMGVVERAADGTLHLRTREGRAVRLQAAPAAFRPGMKVWVQGPGSITVQSYGIVRN